MNACINDPANRPWGVTLDRGVPAGLSHWLIHQLWIPQNDVALQSLHLAHLEQISEPAALASSSRPIIVDGLPLQVSEQGQRFQLEAAGGGCWFDLGTQAPHPLRCWGDRPHAAVLTALTEIFRAHGWLTLHCSAVIEPGEQAATLFLGNSGSGKTYRLLQRLAANAQPLAEDHVCMRLDDPLVIGRDRSFRVLPDTQQVFAKSLRATGILESDGKTRFQFADLGLNASGPTPLGSIRVLPARGPNNTRNKALNEPANLRAVRALWEAAGMPLTAQGRAGVQRFVSEHHVKVILE